jgi:hypothetical protein
MNELKRIIDNNKVEYNKYNSEYRSKKFENCFDKYKNKYNVSFDNSAGGIDITDEEKQNRKQYLCKLEKINNYCSYEYINACSN